MLTNMFVGRPPGNYDRLLDFSRAVSGSLFFVPSASFLDGCTGQLACVIGAIARGSVAAHICELNGRDSG
jgi:putative iron-dependent peroxidase